MRSSLWVLLICDLGESESVRFVTCEKGKVQASCFNRQVIFSPCTPDSNKKLSANIGKEGITEILDASCSCFLKAIFILYDNIQDDMCAQAPSLPLISTQTSVDQAHLSTIERIGFDYDHGGGDDDDNRHHYHDHPWCRAVSVPPPRFYRTTVLPSPEGHYSDFDCKVNICAGIDQWPLVML